MYRRIVGIIAGIFLLAMPAQAANPVPSPTMQEILIKTSLLSLNDANLTGDYAVFHDKLAKPFREQFTADQLKQAFKAFAEKKVDLSPIAAKPPVATSESKVDARGALLLRGYFDTRPSRVYYELDYYPSEGEWKPLRLNVDVKPFDEKK